MACADSARRRRSRADEWTWQQVDSIRPFRFELRAFTLGALFPRTPTGERYAAGWPAPHPKRQRAMPATRRSSRVRVLPIRARAFASPGRARAHGTPEISRNPKSQSPAPTPLSLSGAVSPPPRGKRVSAPRR